MDNKKRPMRRSIRLKEFDYSSPNAYFFTIVTKHRKCILGTIENGIMILSAEGRIVRDVWESLPRHYPNVQLDMFTIMPDHIHGILILLPQEDGWPQNRIHPLSEILRGLKSLSSRLINRMRGTPGAAVWQRNYHERVIRDEEELLARRNYIFHNPSMWRQKKASRQ